MDSQEVISSENIYTALRVRIFHIILKYIVCCLRMLFTLTFFKDQD